MSLHYRYRSVLLFMAAAFALGIALWLVLAREDSLARVRENHVIRIGYAVEAPYAFVARDGRVSGVSPALARLVATRMGDLHVEWVQTPFDNLIPDLLEGRFDVIGAGMFITRERAGLIRFAEPSLRVAPGLLVRAGNPEGLRSYQDAIANPRIRLAVISGSIEQRRLLARGMPATRLLAVPDASTARAAIESGAADALALSLPSVDTMAQARPAALQALAVPGRATADEPDSAFYVSFAFAPEHAHLRQAWNQAQAEVVGSSSYIDAIRPFGFTGANLPGPVTLSSLLPQ